ncbi:unannotated protein [freshwater metagenome]|uniref:Unannotated protein n=1 Tax=freshwater metagenome TaxID=449393 RepID=A0A6J7P8L2_9ZZZZ
MEVLHLELDTRLMSDREEVQHRVSRAAERHDDGNRVLERLLRDDVLRRDALTDKFDDRLS